MKKIPALVAVCLLIGMTRVTAQSIYTKVHNPTYRELKESRQLESYTPEQLTELQINEINSPQDYELGYGQQTRNIDPPTPSTQTTSNAFTITPLNPSICSGQSVTLSASNTFTYSTTGLYIADDMWSSIIPLPFTFTFYGIQYTSCILSTNGSIGFNTAYANWWASWWVTGNNQPTTLPADMRNTISGAWYDLYLPSGGSHKYSTIGTAPNRIFLVEYCNTGHWGCWNSVLFTGQILLYEGTNIIETHILNRPYCWWMSGHGVHSTQNSAGNMAAVVAGRNTSDAGWTTTNEGKRWTWNNSTLNYDISDIAFNPTGFFNASTISWYDASNTLISTGATYSVPTSLSAGTYVYHAQVTTSWCGGTISYTAYDTVTVTNALTAPTATSVTICPNSSASLSASCGGNCLWYNVSTGGTPLGTGFYTTPTLSSTTTYYVGYASGACVSPRTPVTVTIGPTLAAPTGTTSSVCDISLAASLSANCGGNCEWYTVATGGSPVGIGSPFTTTPPTTTYYVQTNVGGCTSTRTPVIVNVGSLLITATTNINCPLSQQNLSTVATGASIVTVPIVNSTASDFAIDSATCTDPDNVDCPSTNYVTSMITTPVNVSNPMTSVSVQSVYVKLNDLLLGAAVGADTKMWLRTPAGTLLNLTTTRPFNTNTDSNYCYCPTFTRLGTNGVLPNSDGPYNALNYTPEGGILDFTGENPYANSGIWTLYVNDNTGLGGQSFGFLFIEDFRIIFSTYPPSSYNWTSSGTCGTLSSTVVSNPTYIPPSVSGNYNCLYTVTVTNGSCTGTASVDLGCNVLPVSLLNYTGKNTTKGNLLNWTTATEINNSFFTIERYENDQDSNSHWKVPSRAFNGNSTTSLEYSLTDKEVKAGVYYYHLFQTDINGLTKDLGRVAIAVRNGNEMINVKPNPTSNVAEVTYSCQGDETATLKIFDHSGNQMMMKKIICSKEENKINLDLSDSADGIYLITITTHNNIYKARLIKCN
jgi:hypothetical protein